MILTFLSKAFKLVYSKFKNIELREQCIADKTAKFYYTARIDNISRKRNYINIGKYTSIRGELILFAHGGNITIGDFCFIGENSKIWSAKNINIGDRVLISHNVNIHDNNSHPLNAIERHEHFKKMLFEGHPSNGVSFNEKAINICDDVWIGFNSIILKGVTIGKGAIIAAGSVVINDVEPYTIVAGNPARFLMKNNN